ncbi:MAG: hypothetical protein K2X49_27285 [Acetobacteraceae bacterium]|nr:hypothetical protein [Acetobacteraceae bacterium]
MALAGGPDHAAGTPAHAPQRARLRFLCGADGDTRACGFSAAIGEVAVTGTGTGMPAKTIVLRARRDGGGTDTYDVFRGAHCRGGSGPDPRVSARGSAIAEFLPDFTVDCVILRQSQRHAQDIGGCAQLGD